METAMETVRNIDLNMVLYVFGGLIGLYVIIMIIAGLKGGLTSMKKIWFWTKKIGWLVLIVVGFILVMMANSRKGSKKKQIDADIAELERIEKKTNEDQRKLEEKKKERDKVESDIIETTRKYQEKLDKLKEKPDAPKPGDAGRSNDDMNNTW